jgi:hypothetical protein
MEPTVSFFIRGKLVYKKISEIIRRKYRFYSPGSCGGGRKELAPDSPTYTAGNVAESIFPAG